MPDDKFNLGIKNAVEVCMNIQSDDRVLVITDEITETIGNALTNKSSTTGAASQSVKLEDLGSRPMLKVPDELLEILKDFHPTVTFYAAASLEGEVRMRMDLTRKIQQIFTALDQPLPRHAHMVSITPQLIREGMTADYHEINKLTYSVLDLVENAKEIQVNSRKGTDITAQINSDYRWVPCHGLYHHPGDWGNLPEGEVFTCPGKLEGVLVVDVLGDYFSPKYGVLTNPVTITVEDSHVSEVSCPDQKIAEELMAYLKSAANGQRAGEFAIGTNTAVKHLTGNLLQDEKIPGIHVAFGNPSSHKTGADWHSDVHVDVVPVECTISIDGKTIMEDGKFRAEVLKEQ